MKKYLFIFLLFSSFLTAQVSPVLPEVLPISNERPDSSILTNLIPVFVTYLFDGDGFTCRTLKDSIFLRVRFANVDAPERTSIYTYAMQPYAMQSRDSLSKLVYKDTVYLDTLIWRGKVGKRSYDRVLADVYLKDGTYLQHLQVEKGWVWAVQTSFRKNAKINANLLELMKETKALKLGLFANPRRIYLPATWREDYSTQ